MVKDDRETAIPGEVQSPPVSRILLGALASALATIPLGRRSLASSSHLPAASPSRITGRLFGVAPRRDCPFHPTQRGSTLSRRSPATRYARHLRPGGRLASPPLSRLWQRATRAASRSTRLCCSDPHLTVGRRYLLRRSAESGLSSASVRRRGCPADFADRILCRATGFQAHFRPNILPTMPPHLARRAN